MVKCFFLTPEMFFSLREYTDMLERSFFLTIYKSTPFNSSGIIIAAMSKLSKSHTRSRRLLAVMSLFLKNQGRIWLYIGLIIKFLMQYHINSITPKTNTPFKKIFFTFIIRLFKALDIWLAILHPV